MARNASGTESLPAGNPVVAGTTITPTWANDTLTDLATEITDSLSRSGKGGMLAALKNVDGAVGAPAVSFNDEATTGFYRSGAGELAASILGTIKAKLTASAFLSDVFQTLTDVSLTLKSSVADGASAVAHIFDSTVDFANAGAKLASFRRATAEKAYINKDGKVFGTGLDAGSAVVSNVATPVAATDAATKAYVDNNNPGKASMTGDVAIGDSATNLTGLTFACADATTYHWRARIYFTQSNNAVTLAWGTAAGPTTSYFRATATRITNNTASVGDFFKCDSLDAFNTSVTGYGVELDDSNFYWIEGWFKTTGTGTFQLTLTAGAGSNYTVKAGSYLEWTAT